MLKNTIEWFISTYLCFRIVKCTFIVSLSFFKIYFLI